MKHVNFFIKAGFIFSFLCLALSSKAQQSRIFLFKDFTKGTVLMKNRSKTTSMFNYDAANKAMMFKEKEETMLLTNTQEVDTIFINDRKFIPANRIFLEVIPVDNGTIYINWVLKKNYQGKKGAYGQTTQTNVTVINTNHFQPGTEYEVQSADVNKLNNENEYWIFINDKPVKFKNKKSLLKCFPDHTTTIEDFIKANKTDMQKPEQVVELINYCLKLQSK